MIGKCLLETDGYKIIFELKSLETSKKDVDLIVEFHLNPHLGSLVVKSVPTFTAIKDLERLVNYFEEHIARLKVDPDNESSIFITYGLGFQIQALSGEVRSLSDGEFTMRFMANVGKIDFEASRTYVGGESSVTLENITNFTSSLQGILRELSYVEAIL